MTLARSIAMLTSAALAATLAAPGGCRSPKNRPAGDRHRDNYPPTTEQALPTAATVPAGARLIAEGYGAARYTARDPGTVYVYSRDDRRVVLQYNLQAGETFTLSPSAAQTSFAADRHAGASGRGTLSPSAGGYEVYFLSNGPATASQPAASTP